jgi:hypothetical protein
MTSVTRFVDCSLKYNANTKYLQPALYLSDNIITHAVSKEIWLAVFKHFMNSGSCSAGYTRNRPSLITSYYNREQVLTVETRIVPGFAKPDVIKKLEVVFHVSRIHLTSQRLEDKMPDPSQQPELEFVAENNFELSVNQFPLSYDYSHTRQSLRWKISGNGFFIVMELLLDGLRAFEELRELAKIPVENLVDHKTVFSRSFRIYLGEDCKANQRNISDELSEHVNKIRLIFSRCK